MQWLKLMGAVPVAFAIAACSPHKSNNDTATSAGVLSDSLGYGVDTNPAKKLGTQHMDSLKADSARRDSAMWDTARKNMKAAAKKGHKKGH